MKKHKVEVQVKIRDVELIKLVTVEVEGTDDADDVAVCTAAERQVQGLIDQQSAEHGLTEEAVIGKSEHGKWNVLLTDFVIEVEDNESACPRFVYGDPPAAHKHSDPTRPEV